MTAEIVPLRPAYGATPEDWSHLELLLGSRDLLPVVSNPHAQRSEQSTLKMLGKTPSTYNVNRRVVGFPKWTQHEATPRDIARWVREPDYGICIQTREVRALDIDVADETLAADIRRVFAQALGLTLPARGREGTGKVLLAFRMVGELRKRSFKVEDGLVELLATGQQFIAVGTHPSGSRYVWEDGLPYEVPEIAQAQLEAAWAELVALFAKEPAVEGAEGANRDRSDLEGINDPVADYLYDKGLALGAQGEKVFVACPWKDGHSGDSGISETTWLVAGTRGFEQGHFQCMHASCSKRTRGDFLEACGYITDGFVDLDDPEAAGDAGEASPGPAGGKTLDANLSNAPWPKFKRDQKGRIEAVLGNVELALARPDICGLEVRFDTFRDELMVIDHEVRPFEDADAVDIRVRLEARGFKPVGREILRDALLKHGRDNRFDSAQAWLTGLPPWDGVERIDQSMFRYFATQDTAYTQAVGAYLWTALAGRIMDPGCKADMALVLQGDQGIRKSSAVAVIPPTREMFREISLDALDANLSRKLRGCVVGELAELRGLKSREAEPIKAWIAQQEERWTPKYLEREIAFKRRCVLIGTSNPADILDDETGERRWLPVECKGRLDVEALERDRDQLWAEGLLRWHLEGVAWREAERLARGEHHKFKVRDEWQDDIERWLDTAADLDEGVSWDQRGWVTTADISRLALGLDVRSRSPYNSRRVAKIMRGMGWTQGPYRGGDRVVWAWIKDVR